MASNKEISCGSVHECFYKCESKKHAFNLIAAVTKSSLSDEKVAAYLKWCCIKYVQAVDPYGRTLLHMAASKGRLKLLKFLLTHKEVNINGRDLESFYSALHRSLFYGQIHCAVRLIQAGANKELSDFEDLTPLDHIIKDRPNILTYNINLPCEVYVWGTNTNYTLGIGHNHSRSHPEALDFFRKENISVKQGLISKFHSLFLGTNGKVWTCGVGMGGRLGLGDETTTLIPKPLKIGSNSSESCISASLGIDHSVLLMENGSAWSFGLNKYHQLGHSPAPEKLVFPKAIKALKGIFIIGVSASKFHTVFWTQNQVYTCGLHGGQLGHSKTNENTIVVPKLVTLLQLKASTITQVATSDGASVAVNSKGDVFLFHEYQCKKLTAKTNKLKAKKICVIGGHLDHRVYSSCLQEKGGDELKIIILTLTNRIYVWQETYPQMTHCQVSLHRYLVITDIVLNRANLILTTFDGEAFLGEIKSRKRKIISDDDKTTSKANVGKLLTKDDSNLLKLKKIPHIHRAVTAACDLKGRNFAVVQVHPKAGLLEIPLVQATEMKENMKMLLTTASEFDDLHDVLFQVEGIRFPAHQYVVCHSSCVLEDLINKSEVINNVCHVKIENVQPQIFQRILLYLYTGECDLLQKGVCPIGFDSPVFVPNKELLSEAEIINKENISAFEYYKQQKPKKKKNELKNETKTKDPIKALRDAARIFGLTDLIKTLEFFRYEGGYIFQINDQNLKLSPPKFNRKNLQNLWDLSLESDNGDVIKVHKCILITRMEYFNCMINQGWMESTMKTPLKLPIPRNVLEILIRFLYTDEAPELTNSEDSDLASHVLVIADQYFCIRLKEIAEASLGNMLNLKNAVEVLQLAVTYNANQLKQCAMEFICLNLSALLESQSLEILDDSVLTDLKDFYRSWLPCMSSRNVASFSNVPDDDLVEVIYNSEPVSFAKNEEETIMVKPLFKTPKKKSHREKKSSESESRKTRNTSTGSTASDEEMLSSLDYSDIGVREETWIKVTNHSTKHQQKIKLAKSKFSQSEAEYSKTPLIEATKTSAIFLQKSSPINVEYASPKMKKEDSHKFGKDCLFLSTSCEKEFPALSASAPDKIINIGYTKSSNESFKKLVKISQKQRRKLVFQSTSESEESSWKSENIKSVWGIPKYETQSLVDIMKQEVNCGLIQTSLATSSQRQEPLSPGYSLPEIMAAERLQKGLLSKMKTKPLELTQMEDKAIDDLMLLYNIQNVTDERITIRRADFVLHSPPVWVTSQR